AANECCALSEEESGVSHVPSDSQSQRAWRVALGSESVDEVASNVIVSFTEGTVGEYTRWAVGPGAVIVTAAGGAGTRASLLRRRRARTERARSRPPDRGTRLPKRLRGVSRANSDCTRPSTCTPTWSPDR